MRLIDTQTHATLDYLTGIVLLVMPYMLSLPEPSVQSNIFYIAGSAVLLYATLSNYELGMLKIIPLPSHFLLDIAVGAMVGTSPWLFGFQDQVSVPYITMGVVLCVLPIITAWQKHDDDKLIDP